MLYLQRLSFIVVILLPQGWHCMPMSYEQFLKGEIMAGSNARELTGGNHKQLSQMDIKKDDLKSIIKPVEYQEKDQIDTTKLNRLLDTKQARETVHDNNQEHILDSIDGLKEFHKHTHQVSGTPGISLGNSWDQPELFFMLNSW
ncbi:hypothetical protein PGT21_014471 [Puccinia graminis f. sp. tritici]|uniref:Uncharacterized protein n=1 Tax=Puccinia graminis f. sp. tritici TaxID=56615 RepID=A0A5B0PTX6_PUCGR|nr:hypothetical protein PGT21_014471 [Puccinia graminis f. sp. tritici]